MATTCIVTRTELSLANLDINSTPYGLTPDNGFTPGGITYLRHRASSPFVHGDLEVHAVKRHSTLELSVEVVGVSSANLWTAVDALVAAFEQRSYTVTLSIDGTQRSYDCQAADYVLSDRGVVSNAAILGLFQVVRFSCPRSPIPLVGRL